MFQQRLHRSRFGGFLAMSEVVYHSVGRSVRSKHNNAFIALGLNLMQAVMFVLVFYAMFAILGMRGSAIRGDFLLYVMSGIFLFLTHAKAVGAVAGAEGPMPALEGENAALAQAALPYYHALAAQKLQC